MNIVYFANFGNKGSDDTEEHIAHSLTKLGHNVLKIHERDPMSVPRKAYDLFLFHKGGQYVFSVLDKMEFPPVKACWYFDKVWNGRDQFIKEVVKRNVKLFLSDATWARANLKDWQYSVLRQGIGDRDTSPGRQIGQISCYVAFTGAIYGDRVQWVKQMDKTFPGQFQAFNDKFNRDLYDLCASVPIMVAPPYPSDHHYWSSRIYMILGSGGFLLHPYCHGLEEDGLKDGVHYAAYRDMLELERKVKFYLQNPNQRERIREAGYRHVTEKLTYTIRCQKLCEAILPLLNTGMSASTSSET